MSRSFDHLLAKDVAQLNAEKVRRERAALEALKTWRKEGREGNHEFAFRIEPVIDAVDALLEFEFRHWNPR